MSETQLGELLLLLTAAFGLFHLPADVLAGLRIPARLATEFVSVGNFLQETVA